MTPRKQPPPDGVFRRIRVPGRFTAADPRIEFIPETGCWIWMKATDRHGYGVSSKNDVWVFAHRAFYEQAKGPIPPGMFLDHIVCRVRCCVNPDHVRVVTPTVNSLENNIGPVAQNLLKTHCSVCGSDYIQRDGHRVCPTCSARHSSEWSKKKRATDPAWRAAKNARCRAYALENKEMLAEKRRVWYAANRDRIVAQRRAVYTEKAHAC